MGEKKPGKPDKSLPFDIDFSLLKNKTPQQIAVILRELILKNPEEIGIDVENLPKDKLFGMDIKLLRKKPAEDVVFLMYEHVVQTCPSHEHPVEQKPDEEKPVEKKPEEKKPGKPDKSDKFGDKKKPMEEDIKPEEEKPVEQKPDEKKPEEKKPEEKKPGKPDKSLPFDIDFSLLKNKSPQQIAVILRELILKNPEKI